MSAGCAGCGTQSPHFYSHPPEDRTGRSANTRAHTGFAELDSSQMPSGAQSSVARREHAGPTGHRQHRVTSKVRKGADLCNRNKHKIGQNETEECVPSEGMRRNFRKRIK